MNEPTLFDVSQRIPDKALERYHNTTKLEGSELKQREVKTKTQNWLILEYFRSHSYETFTPSELFKRMDLPGVPLTSIRRGISDLTEMDYLIKTDVKRPGMYGAMEYTWRVR